MDKLSYKKCDTHSLNTTQLHRKQIKASLSFAWTCPCPTLCSRISGSALFWMTISDLCANLRSRLPLSHSADDTHLRKLILPETLAQLGSSCLFFFFFYFTSLVTLPFPPWSFKCLRAQPCIVSLLYSFLPHFRPYLYW